MSTPDPSFLPILRARRGHISDFRVTVKPRIYHRDRSFPLDRMADYLPLLDSSCLETFIVETSMLPPPTFPGRLLTSFFGQEGANFRRLKRFEIILDESSSLDFFSVLADATGALQSLSIWAAKHFTLAPALLQFVNANPNIKTINLPTISQLEEFFDTSFRTERLEDRPVVFQRAVSALLPHLPSFRCFILGFYQKFTPVSASFKDLPLDFLTGLSSEANEVWKARSFSLEEKCALFLRVANATIQPDGHVAVDFGVGLRRCRVLLSVLTIIVDEYRSSRPEDFSLKSLIRIATSLDKDATKLSSDSAEVDVLRSDLANLMQILLMEQLDAPDIDGGSVILLVTNQLFTLLSSKSDCFGEGRRFEAVVMQLFRAVDQDRRGTTRGLPHPVSFMRALVRHPLFQPDVNCFWNLSLGPIGVLILSELLRYPSKSVIDEDVLRICYLFSQLQMGYRLRWEPHRRGWSGILQQLLCCDSTLLPAIVPAFNSALIPSLFVAELLLAAKKLDFGRYRQIVQFAHADATPSRGIGFSRLRPYLSSLWGAILLQQTDFVQPTTSESKFFSLAERETAQALLDTVSGPHSPIIRLSWSLQAVVDSLNEMNASDRCLPRRCRFAVLVMPLLSRVRKSASFVESGAELNDGSALSDACKLISKSLADLLCAALSCLCTSRRIGSKWMARVALKNLLPLVDLPSFLRKVSMDTLDALRARGHTALVAKFAEVQVSPRTLR